MGFKSVLLAGGLLFATAACPALAADPNARVVDEGMNRSQVIVLAHELMDDIGPRLTISTNMRKAQDWAMAKFAGFGLSNVHREGFRFGRGWDMIDTSARLVSPRSLKLEAIAAAWTPGTNGAITAPVIVAPMEKIEHFAAYRGKLRGKIVLYQLPGEGSESSDPVFHRLTGEEIAKEDSYKPPRYDPDSPAEWVKRLDFVRQLDRFAAEEGAVALVSHPRWDGSLLGGTGYMYEIGDTAKLPRIDLTAEDYRRVARMAAMGDNPTLEIRSDVRFLDDDPNAYNVIADIPGSDPKAGYVMAGAHFDSWIAGDGASDNGAGSVVVMEAARIIKALGIRPKRTIRFALWSGEEQGLFGSAEYVQAHVASRPAKRYPGGSLNWDETTSIYPVTPLADYGRLKAYFNIDNGSGKVRGIYSEGNAAATPMLREWLSPFNSMGATAVVAGPTTGTDHEAFQAVGVTGFQFIQDPLDYGTRVHHTNVDTLDHMKADDLRQASVVLAGMLLAAANSDKELPRPPLPTQPVKTDPFKVDYPETR